MKIKHERENYAWKVKNYTENPIFGGENYGNQLIG
jgi:hypothetical protein